MKKLAALAILILASACGMNRPFTPTISYINGDTMTPYGGAVNQYVSTTDLAFVQLNWDVSNVPGANAVKIIASYDYTCETELATSYQNIISTYVLPANPERNLRNLFINSINTFTAGTYYICIRPVKMGKVGPVSLPVTLNLTLNQVAYLTPAEEELAAKEVPVELQEEYEEEEDSDIE